MQTIFIVISIFGALYFLLAKRRFDFFTVGFFSACIYFLPGYFGYAIYPAPTSMAGEKYPVELVGRTYLVMILLLVFIMVAAFFYDSISKKKKEVRFYLKRKTYVSHVALVLAFLGCAFTLYSSGNVLFSTDKQYVLDSLTRWHILWEFSALIGVAVAFVEKRWRIMWACWAFLIFDMYIGFRSAFAISMISTAVIYFSQNGNSRLILKNKIMLLFFSFGASLIFLYKQIYITIKAGDMSLLLERLTTSDVYINSIIYSEPFTTQVILNEVITENFKVSGAHFVGLINNLLLFSPSLGLESQSFNDLFQSSLFPYHEHGMANNIWAEMWASGGWGLLIAFMFFFALVILLGSYLLRISNSSVKGGVAVFFSYWAFYIHRCDLGYQVTLEKRVLLIWGICMLISAFVVLFIKTLQKPPVYEANGN